MEKEREVIEKITKYVIDLCNSEFGFAGLADGGDLKMINSGKEKDIIIKIQVKES